MKRVYELTRSFPADERFGLVQQMRRAGVSSGSTKEFVHFISIAEGSLAELETQLVIALELGFCKHEAVATLSGLMDEERRMLNGLRRKL